MSCADTPCPTCPWRRTSTAGGADIPGFSIEDMRALKNTVPPRGSRQDGFRSIMACHHSKGGKEYACAGYVAQHGETNFHVRLMGLRGADLNRVIQNCADIDLYDNFHEMLDTFEEALTIEGQGATALL